MAKEQKRGNRETRKPKAAPKPAVPKPGASPFANGALAPGKKKGA